MKSVAIIGVGSPYGADQTGWQLVDMLKHDPTLNALAGGDIHYMLCEHPGLMLLDRMRGFDSVILLDAVAGGQKGSVIWLKKEQLLGEVRQLSTHNLGVKQVLMLGDQLDFLPQDVDLIGVAVGDTARAYEPTAETVLQVKDLVYNAIQEYFTA